jgi:hypothetical protein
MPLCKSSMKRITRWQPHRTGPAASKPRGGNTHGRTVLTILLYLSSAAGILAEAGPAPAVSRFSIAGGAGAAAGPALRIDHLVGQSDASRVMTGRQFRMVGGFLPAREVAGFRDGFESGDLSAWSISYPSDNATAEESTTTEVSTEDSELRWEQP